MTHEKMKSYHEHDEYLWRNDTKTEKKQVNFLFKMSNIKMVCMLSGSLMVVAICRVCAHKIAQNMQIRQIFIPKILKVVILPNILYCYKSLIEPNAVVWKVKRTKLTEKGPYFSYMQITPF
jgi:hypothetical protein